MSKRDIKAEFYSKEPLGNESVQLVGWSGNHWDNISYFPKNYQIGFVKQGRGEFFVGNDVYLITEGQLFLIHPGRIHSGKPDEQLGWSVDTIAIKVSLVEELFNSNVPIKFQDFVVADNELKKLFLKTVGLLSGYQASIENEGRLYLFLTDLLKLKATILQQDEANENQNNAVQRAIDFITKNYHLSFSLDELAEQSFLSKFHLLRTFKIKTGLTPYAYQMQLKLNEARRLIFQEKSLTEIAHDLGFSDQAHFTNTFKKHANGANPSDLLKTAISYNFQE
jgi:AraC-like DNA-binding protein